MLARSAGRARRLRKASTFAERRLWEKLRSLEGLKFRRQHPIGGYVADFACLSLKLAVEVDGGIHRLEEVQLRDLARTEVIERLGWDVVRVTNEEAVSDVDRVLAAILARARLIQGT